MYCTNVLRENAKLVGGTTDHVRESTYFERQCKVCKANAIILWVEANVLQKTSGKSNSFEEACKKHWNIIFLISFKPFLCGQMKCTHIKVKNVSYIILLLKLISQVSRIFLFLNCKCSLNNFVQCSICNIVRNNANKTKNPICMVQDLICARYWWKNRDCLTVDMQLQTWDTTESLLLHSTTPCFLKLSISIQSLHKHWMINYIND